MDVLLSYRGNELAFYDFHYSAVEDKKGNPFCCSFRVRVKSGSYAADTFCEYGMKEFEEMQMYLEMLSNFAWAYTDFDDRAHGNILRFRPINAGFFSVAGTLRDDEGIHTMSFLFEVEQAVLNRFARDTKMLIDEAKGQ